MTQDLLEKATRALRETSAEPNSRSGLTRARLLESAEKRARRRSGFWLRWGIGVFAALGASTALARVAQQYWPELQRVIAPAEQREPTTERRRKRPSAPPPPSAVTPEVEPPSAAPEPPVPPPDPAPSVQPDAEPPPPPKRARPKLQPRRVEPAPAPSSTPAPEAVAAPAPVPAAESAELALFRRAQRLHLAHDARALEAWNDYLRVAERGVLVPEARYNRALCLVRAGRKAEARAALEPFARGEYGDYRRREAAALLDALSASDKPR